MTQDKVAEALAAIPPLEKDGTLTGPNWDDAIKVFEAVLDSVPALVDLLRDVDDGQDYRARYVLHGLAHYLGRPGMEAKRAKFAADLAAQLPARTKPVQGFLARQLQVVGGPEQAPALGKLLADAEVGEYAAQALLAIRVGAAEEFRKALPGLTGAPRLTVLQALGVLKDSDSIDALRKAAADENVEVRLTAAWGLANIGAPAAVETVLKVAEIEPGYARIKANASCMLLAEKLLAAGHKAEAAKIYRHLKETRTADSEGYLRELAADGLAAAGG